MTLARTHAKATLANVRRALQSRRNSRPLTHRVRPWAVLCEVVVNGPPEAALLPRPRKPVPVGQEHRPRAVSPPLVEVALVPVAVRGAREHAVAVPPVHQPPAHVRVPICVRQRALPRRVVVHPLPAEHVAVGVLQLALAVLLARGPVADVSVALPNGEGAGVRVFEGGWVGWGGSACVRVVGGLLMLLAIQRRAVVMHVRLQRH